MEQVKIISGENKSPVDQITIKTTPNAVSNLKKFMHYPKR